MTWVIVPNSLVDEINAGLDSAFKEVPGAEKDREFFYQQLLHYVEQHGFLPDFKLQKIEEDGKKEEIESLA